MEPDIDLSGLKDIHVFAPPPVFPPAIGWWLVLGGVLVLLALIGICIYYWRKSPKRYALILLNKLQSEPLDMQEIGVQLGILLKRVSLLKFKREDVAALSGQAWSDFLQKQGQGALSKEQADFIASSAYLPKEKAVAIQKETLYTDVKRWIVTVLAKDKTWK